MSIVHDFFILKYHSVFVFPKQARAGGRPKRIFMALYFFFFFWMNIVSIVKVEKKKETTL